MLLYDVLRDSPLFDVDPHAHLPDLECLYIVVGLLSAAYHTHHTETLAALLPWVTGCLGPNVTCGAPIAAGSAAFASQARSPIAASSSRKARPGSVARVARTSWTSPMRA